MMYWFYRKHHIKPSDYQDLGTGEKLILRAFFLQECEDIKKEQQKINEAVV